MQKLDPDMEWSREDALKARAMGWNLEQVMALEQDGEGRPGHRVKYALMWFDPAKMGYLKGEQPPIEDFVSNNAALGIAIYEKAWRLFGILFLHGAVFQQGVDNAVYTEERGSSARVLDHLTDKDQP